MVEGKDRIEKENKIMLKDQKRSIHENREVLELLATETIEAREEEKGKLLMEVNEAFEEIRKNMWQNPEFLEVMRKLED